MFFLLATPLNARAGDAVVFTSTKFRTHLLELFSSEGCSSCPPAEKWLTELRQEATLFKTFLPLQFHVDYWDNLGWPDNFAKSAFTRRQTEYSEEWGTGNVYTPGFVLDGKEWRNRDLSSLQALSDEVIGILRLESRSNYVFQLAFSPEKRFSETLFAHCALLGNRIKTKVLAGENAGETLAHDFIVLALENSEMKSNPTSSRDLFTNEIRFLNIKLFANQMSNDIPKSIACWLTSNSSLRPLQAVGGDLPPY